MGFRRSRGRSRRETPEQAWARMSNGRAMAAAPPERPAPPPSAPPSSSEPSSVATPPLPPTPAPPPARSGAQGGEPSAGELVKRLSEQTSTLVKQEMALAQAELKEKGKKAGIGAGFFGIGGLVAFFGGAVLVAAAVLGLSTALDAWLSALIVGVVLLVAAGVAALMGKKQIEQATPPAPEAAVASVKKDVETVKERARA